MAKRIITISREFGSGGRFMGKEVAKNLVSPIMIRISLDGLQNSPGSHRSTFRKMLNYLPRKDCLPMLFLVVILQENR